MDALAELRSLVAGFPAGSTRTRLPRVEVAQGEIPAHALASVYSPMVNLIVNGGKDLFVAGRSFHYDASTYFVLSLDLPATGVVHAAADGTPYQAIALKLEPEVLSEVVSLQPENAAKPDGKAYGVCPTTPELLDAWPRLLRLVRAPADIPALAPLYEREILYRVLAGPLGWLLRDLARPESALTQVRRAVEWIRLHYQSAFHVDELARQTAMSPSTLRRHFRQATGQSPIQYQKKFRLLAARRLLTASGRSVGEAAFEVGYESASQFSREYSGFFGHSPAQAGRAARFGD
jgi:AraC-like DNA-binding protein